MREERRPVSATRSTLLQMRTCATHAPRTVGSALAAARAVNGGRWGRGQRHGGRCGAAHPLDARHQLVRLSNQAINQASNRGNRGNHRLDARHQLVRLMVD
eukprot:394620-Prymnesium_polylepis.1